VAGIRKLRDGEVGEEQREHDPIAPRPDGAQPVAEIRFEGGDQESAAKADEHELGILTHDGTGPMQPFRIYSGRPRISAEQKQHAERQRIERQPPSLAREPGEEGKRKIEKPLEGQRPGDSAGDAGDVRVIDRGLAAQRKKNPLEQGGDQTAWRDL
jgi:hypothetical protein